MDRPITGAGWGAATAARNESAQDLEEVSR
ncbi:hypothetical protein BMS3Bbin12_01560 [bacterium BMS3Bbin12]|nr:hypothetical protein BMS3Abin12_01203 [bacterium BMS3Abin12]GBE48382.1 hypothetical protein BMS3Bbin12_01560 [bacterium BMS3Bbin12]GBE50527.1 hypothetical protein BMS3Bbin13_01467 [bacterium BMS3Bbin13]